MYIIIKGTLFFINKDFEVNIILEKLIFNKVINKMNILIKEIKLAYKKLKYNIKFFNIYIKKYTNNLQIRE